MTLGGFIKNNKQRLDHDIQKMLDVPDYVCDDEKYPGNTETWALIHRLVDRLRMREFDLLLRKHGRQMPVKWTEEWQDCRGKEPDAKQD